MILVDYRRRVLASGSRPTEAGGSRKRIQEGGIHPWFQDACTGDFPVQKDGYLPIPPGPGLGVGMDEDWIEANPWRDDAAVWRAGDGSIASRQDTNWS